MGRVASDPGVKIFAKFPTMVQVCALYTGRVLAHWTINFIWLFKGLVKELKNGEFRQKLRVPSSFVREITKFWVEFHRIIGSTFRGPLFSFTSAIDDKSIDLSERKALIWSVITILELISFKIPTGSPFCLLMLECRKSANKFHYPTGSYKTVRMWANKQQHTVRNQLVAEARLLATGGKPQVLLVQRFRWVG